MDIVFFTHPTFLGSQSMPRFASWLSEGMKQKGHRVDTWTASPFFYKLPVPRKIRKYLGYIDQYILFPVRARKLLNKKSADTLFVFTDHALGPWVPLVAGKRNHVVHCHDFLAQRSALGTISENQTGWTGKRYQSYIRNGYRQSHNFICTSEMTKKDLSTFLIKEPDLSVVVYNGMNRNFAPADPQVSRNKLATLTGLPVEEGYILHVGGNQWYKNRHGIIEIYNQWRLDFPNATTPLLLIGEPPSIPLEEARKKSPYSQDILIQTNAGDELVGIAYTGASVFLFPSLAEGFGWPIAEAMASGIPVITTGEMPMTEVAGDAGFLISRRPDDFAKIQKWAKEGSNMLQHVLSLNIDERKVAIEKGFKNAERFNSGKILNDIEQVYQTITGNSN